MTPNKSNPPPVPPREYDPFSYPHLYPSGWNLDQLPVDDASEAEPEHNALPAWYEPFHDLRTFPSGWDLP